MNIVPKNIRHASLLIEGDRDCNLLDLSLSIIGSSLIAASTPSVLFLTDSASEGMSLQNRLRGWIINYQHSKTARQQNAVEVYKTNCVRFHDNALVGNPERLADWILQNENVSQPAWIIRDDSANTQIGSIGQWHTYANEIVNCIAACVVHLVKRDAMRQLPCDPAAYQVHWQVQDYFPASHNERVGNAVTILDHSTGLRTIWRDKAMAGGASLWFPALDEEIAA